MHVLDKKDMQYLLSHLIDCMMFCNDMMPGAALPVSKLSDVQCCVTIPRVQKLQKIVVAVVFVGRVVSVVFLVLRSSHIQRSSSSSSMHINHSLHETPTKSMNRIRYYESYYTFQNFHFQTNFVACGIITTVTPITKPNAITAAATAAATAATSAAVAAAGVVAETTALFRG